MMLSIASPFLNSVRVQNRNHCTKCWILLKAGPKVWFPKVLSRWRSWVGLGVCLLKKCASMSAVFFKGVITLPNSTCCLQKCFLISMCLVAGLLDGCRPIVIAPVIAEDSCRLHASESKLLHQHSKVTSFFCTFWQRAIFCFLRA